jgi:hypothetical protein
MCNRHPTDKSVRSEVDQFCELVHQLKVEHYVGEKLLGDEQTRSLMEKTAKAFFEVVTKTLIDHFLLEVAKLSDPATSGHGKDENFTIDNMLSTVDWPPDVSSELARLNDAVHQFRDYIKPARNKLLAHYDKRTVLSGKTLGVFPSGEDRKVLDVLEQMCNLMHKASIGGTYGQMVCSRPGDVSGLQKAMEEALAFEKLVGQSKGEDLRRLVQCLQDVGKSGSAE